MHIYGRNTCSSGGPGKAGMANRRRRCKCTILDAFLGLIKNEAGFIMSDKLNSINSYFHFPMLELIVNNIKEGVVVTDTADYPLGKSGIYDNYRVFRREAIRQNPRILKSDYHDHSFYKTSGTQF